MTEQLTRRTTLAAGGGALGAALLAACGSSGGSGGDSGSGSGSGGSDSSQEQSGGNDTDAAGTPLAKIGEVPVGGSVQVASGGDPVLLSQPQKGTVKAFSAICTHQGCKVGADGDRFACPCHGSVFDAASGEVVSGPAPRPLESIPVRIEGDRVVRSS